MSKFILGTWQLGGDSWSSANTEEAYKALIFGFQNGMVEIDTAPTYGNGKSEQMVGQLLRDFKGNDARIITKVPPDMMTAEKVIESVSQSLERLGVDKVDTVLLHWPSGTMGTDVIDVVQTCEGLKCVKANNMADKIGVCNYDFERLKEVEQYIDIEVYQYAYSPLFRAIEFDLIEHIRNKNKELQAYAPLAQGILTNHYNRTTIGEQDHRNWVALFKEEHQELVMKAREGVRSVVGVDNDLALAAMSWVANKNAVPIVGAHKLCYIKHFIENQCQLTVEQVQEIDKQTDALKKAFKNRPDIVSLWG